MLPRWRVKQCDDIVDPLFEMVLNVFVEAEVPIFVVLEIQAGLAWACVAVVVAE
jgi:hypothetical protein